jgi:hypothetical protein
MQLSLTNAVSVVWFAGAGFASKSTYLFGKANVQIKLVPGDSAGTVTAFYVTAIFIQIIHNCCCVNELQWHAFNLQ